MYAKNISKYDVIAELRRLQTEGHSMKIGEFECWLKYEIRKHFGGYKNAKRELSIEVKRLPGGGKKSRYTDEDVKSLLERLLAEGRTSDYVYKKHKDVIDWFHHNHGGGLARACVHYGIAKFKRPKVTHRSKTWTDEKISEELACVFAKETNTSSNHLTSIGHRDLVDAVKRRYGNWNNGLEALGYEVVMSMSRWSKDKIKNETISALNRGVRLTLEGLNDDIKGYSAAASRYFDSFADLKEYCGICATKDLPKEEKHADRSYRVNVRTRKGFKREIARLYYIGAPLNYAAISKKKSHTLNAAKSLFGSWRESLEYCGFNYREDIAITDNSLSECGKEFEELLGDMLTELGITFAKYSHDRFDPDFVLPSGEWIDAKLSEWTDASETIKRYLPECKSLTIVYLRGAKTERYRGSKYQHKTISAYLLADKLSEERRNYYYEKFTEIENRANAGEVGSHLA